MSDSKVVEIQGKQKGRGKGAKNLSHLKKEKRDSFIKVTKN